VDAALTLGSPPHADAEIPLALRWAPLRNALIASTATNPLLTHYFLEQFTTRHEVLTPSRVALYRQAFARRGTTEAFGNWAMQFGEPTAQLLCATPAAYRSLSVPALVLWGERDAVTPLAQGQALAALLPRSRLAVLAGVGHIPQIESPAVFNEQLMAFLGSL
jgi:pimeloyl-ACP methyl ester carboxylesterase